MANLRIVELDKACNSQVVLTAAYRAAMKLQEQGWTHFPAVSWDRPAIVAFNDDECVAGINFTEDLDELTISVNFAWCTRPAALVAVLLRFRKRVRDSKCAEVRFSIHEGNAEMAKAVEVLRAQPFMHSYRMAIPRS